MLPKRKISILKSCGWILSIAASVCFAYFLQPKYHGNANAMTVLTTIFSVLAGFLIAVMAISADDRALRGRTWRHDVAYLELIKRDLRKHRSLFYLYLTVLSLALIATIELPVDQSAQIFIERALLFLGCFALLVSFRLPVYLTKRHVENLNAIILARRAEEQNKNR